MPTVLAHPALPLAIGLGLGRQIISGRLLAAGVAASILPDVDVLAFPLGVQYGSALGHRGFTHSFAFALAAALMGGGCHRALRTRFSRAFLFILASAASHGILDAFTNGGVGLRGLWAFFGQEGLLALQGVGVAALRVTRVLPAA